MQSPNPLANMYIGWPLALSGAIKNSQPIRPRPSLCVCVCYVKVTSHERVNAERYYLMRYNSAWMESRERDEDKRQFEQAHPLYSQLAAGETP